MGVRVPPWAPITTGHAKHADPVIESRREAAFLLVVLFVARTCTWRKVLLIFFRGCAGAAVESQKCKRCMRARRCGAGFDCLQGCWRVKEPVRPRLRRWRQGATWFPGVPRPARDEGTNWHAASSSNPFPKASYSPAPVAVGGSLCDRRHFSPAFRWIPYAVSRRAPTASTHTAVASYFSFVGCDERLDAGPPASSIAERTIPLASGHASPAAGAQRNLRAR